MDKKSQALCDHASSFGGKHSDRAFSQASQDPVKHHVAKPSPGSALDIYLPAEPASHLSLDTKTASTSHIQSDVGLTCKAESTLDDTQRGKAEAATVEYYNYATLADWVFFSCGHITNKSKRRL